MRRLRTRYDRTADGDWFKAYRSNSYRTSSNSPVTAQRWKAPAPFSKGKPLLLLYDSALLPKPINMQNGYLNLGSFVLSFLYGNVGWVFMFSVKYWFKYWSVGISWVFFFLRYFILMCVRIDLIFNWHPTVK